MAKVYKLLELKEPTFVNIKLKITNYESTKASKATFKDSFRPSYANAVNQVSSAAQGATQIWRFDATWFEKQVRGVWIAQAS